MNEFLLALRKDEEQLNIFLEKERKHNQLLTECKAKEEKYFLFMKRLFLLTEQLYIIRNKDRDIFYYKHNFINKTVFTVEDVLIIKEFISELNVNSHQLHLIFGFIQSLSFNVEWSFEQNFEKYLLEITEIAEVLNK